MKELAIEVQDKVSELVRVTDDQSLGSKDAKVVERTKKSIATALEAVGDALVDFAEAFDNNSDTFELVNEEESRIDKVESRPEPTDG